MNSITPKPLQEVNLPPLRQVGAFSQSEEGRESIRNAGILVFGEQASSRSEEGRESNPKDGILQSDGQETKGDRA